MIVTFVVLTEVHFHIRTYLFAVLFLRRITMQPFGQDFKNFFSNSESPLFQRLALLIDFVPTLMVGQRQAIENK